MAAAFALTIIAFIAVFVYISLVQRDIAIGTFDAPELADDTRFQILPVLSELASQHWLFGIGLGSFADYYPIFEADSAITNKYVNEAHNDFFQIVIEGGIVATGIFAALSVWIAKRLVALYRAGEVDKAALLVGVLAIIGLGSAFDYILRTPLIAFVSLCLIGIWSLPQARNGVSLRPDARQHGQRSE